MSAVSCLSCVIFVFPCFKKLQMINTLKNELNERMSYTFHTIAHTVQDQIDNQTEIEIKPHSVFMGPLCLRF